MLRSLDSVPLHPEELVDPHLPNDHFAARRRVGIPAMAIAVLLSCGAPALRTGARDPWPEVTRQATPERTGIPTASLELAATATSFVHDQPEWRSTPLNDRGYLVAGADRRPAFWFAYVSFDLGALDGSFYRLNAHRRPCESGQFSATLALHPIHEPVLPGDDDLAEFRAYRALEKVAADVVTWDDQPPYDPSAYGSVTLRRDDADVDAIDVTDIVCAALRKRQRSLLILIAPGDPSVDFRRRWAATAHRAPTLTLDGGQTWQLGASP